MRSRDCTRFTSFLVLVFVLVTCSPTTDPSAPSSSAVATGAEDGQSKLQEFAPGLGQVQEAFTLPSPPVGTPAGGTSISVGGASGTNALATANVGLSFEASDLADDRWDPTKSTLDELVGALDRPSLRFGGNSIDRRVWWTSTSEPAPDWADVTLAPEDFERLAEFADAADATVTMAVDLGHSDPQRAADYVFYAHQALGERLEGIAIGNEPNGFALASQPQHQIRPDGWGPAEFIAEAVAYEQAIHARTPDMPIVGPGSFDAPWWRAFAESKLPNTIALGQHWYPLWSCDGAKEPHAAPTAANLVSPWLHDRAAFILGMAQSTAAAYGLPVWLEETGPTSCPGTNDSSRTHAQAVWTVDYALHAASLGVKRANFHAMIDACKGGAPMSPICAGGDLKDPTGQIQGQSNYLSMLLVAQLREGQFLPVSVQGVGPVYGYSVQDDDGIDVVLVNLNDPATTGPSPLTIDVPDGLQLTYASLLYADSMAAYNASKLIPWSPTNDLPEVVPAGGVLALRFASE